MCKKLINVQLILNFIFKKGLFQSKSQNINLSNIIAENEEEIDAKTLNVANLKKDVDKLRKEKKSVKKKMETKENNLDEALQSRYKLLQDIEEMTEQKRIQEEEKEATQIAEF